jgi:phage shock protein C
MRRARGELYRLRREGKIAGVCAGLADYFGIETWLVRIICVSAVLFSGPFFIVAYIALWFILDVKPGYEKKGNGNQGHQGHWDQQFQTKSKDDVNAHIRSRFEEKPVVVKERVWQAGEPPRQAFHDIADKFKDLEKRLQNLETYVTSTEFTVSREIDRL